MSKIKEKEWKKIGWFLAIGIITTVIGILIRESLAKVIPSGTLFGWPFNYADFTFVVIFLFGTVIVYLFFKNYKKEIDKKRRLK